ncbi:hypothetical protein EDD22DRAFT_992948 [Suillus occidentalis]|nr:hypothetical protein EDD22DRAFT_992948 [Suillus occidentalis]
MHAIPPFESTRHNSRHLTPTPTIKLKAESTDSKPVPVLYQLYDSADNIPYTPEGALQVGLGMDIWLHEIDNLLSQGAPTTMIAVCGVTGAGKSSILNAILDANIVPTSGMRTCTAVVTEITYHAAPTINVDAEWRAELAVLLDDLVDEDGNVNIDLGVAWHKVHAVYPSIAREQLIHLMVDQILARNKNIAKVLGTTKQILAKNSTIFAQEIAKYIDSMDQTRGSKKDKTKASDGSLMSMLTKDKNKETKKTDHGPALWPLIHPVNVQCNAQALSMGAVLDYMKKCDCIWILAPITHAVDDKTARDLLGEAFKLQLMTSKCDDISCSEVIPALGVEDDPELEEIEGHIEQYKEETADLKQKKTDAGVINKRYACKFTIDKQLKDAQAFLAEHEQHKTALENGETFAPQLTIKANKKVQSMGKKRKNARGGKSGSPKRHKSFRDDDDDDDFEIDDIDDDSDLSDDIYMDDQDVGSDEEDEEEEDDSNGDVDTQDEPEEEVMVEVLQEKIGEAKEAIKVGHEQLNNVHKARKDAIDALSNLKKKVMKAQRDKNTFCSLKHSEFSRDILKEDFRIGLKDLDDAAAKERNPHSFNPTQNLRNYDEIDLPVFTCLSRQVKGNGDPSCFSNIEDTGIPSLWQCSRSYAAKQLHIHLKTFANSVRVYVDGIDDVKIVDCEFLHEKWESTPQGGDRKYDSDSKDEGMPYRCSTHGFLHAYCIPTYQDLMPRMDAHGEPKGVTPQLVKEFGAHVEKCVLDLQVLFHDGLEDKCQVGAANTAAAAVQHVDEFAGSMHWGTYRATLRHHGSWVQDLNVELATPFTQNIALSWLTLFKSDLFTSLSDAITTCISKLITDVENSTVPGLKDCVHAQSLVSQEEVRHALGQTMDVVKEALGREQKEISHCLAPYVQNELMDGYDLAAVFHNYIDSHKHDVFNGRAEVLMRIEVSLAVLWEGTQDVPDQTRA